MHRASGQWSTTQIHEMLQALAGKGKRFTQDVADDLTRRWGVTVTEGALRGVQRRHGRLEAPREAHDTEPFILPAAPYVPPTVDDYQAEHEERSELQDLRNAKRMLLEELKGRDAQIKALTELRASNPLPPIAAPHKVGGHQRAGVSCMILSDLHVEERVEPEKVNYLNEYNLDIANKCLSEATSGFLWLTQDPRFDIRTAVVAIIGDTFSGHIHAELVESNFLAPVKAVVWLQGRVERELRRIAAENQRLERIIVVFKDGNHGRLTQKIRCSTRTDNSLEWLMFQTIAARMADDPRFEFIVEEGVFTYLDVYDTSLCFAHGDIWRGGDGVGGIMIPLNKGFSKLKRMPRKIDHLIIGHFHNRQDTGPIIVNGSMIGVTPYSLSNCFPAEPRQQSWFLIDSEYGKCLSAPITLPQYVP